MYDTLTRTGVLLVALLVVTGGGVGAAAAAPAPQTADAPASDLGTQPVSQVANQATVSFEDQATNGSELTVQSATLPDGGYVAIYDASIDDDEITPEGLLGATSFLEAGTSENVTVTLDEPIGANTTLVAVAHEETNQAGDTANATFDFAASNGTDDGPYASFVRDDANVTVPGNGQGPGPGPNASVTFDDQTTDGTTVTVANVTLGEGGYVAIHDETLANDTLGSVIGASGFLPAGTSENVTVTLDEPLTENQTLTAMAHRETNQAGDTANATFDFVTSNGTDDGPYESANGTLVTDDANVTVEAPNPGTDGNASVTFEDQTTTGETVVVANTTLPEGGYVTIHDETLLDGDAVGSVVGVSSFLDAGTSENVTVTLDEPLTENQTLIAMSHQETNQAGDTANATYDFVTSNGTDDVPYVDANGTAITDDANVTVETVGPGPDGNASVTFEDQTTTGETVTVANATLPEGGYLSVVNASALDGNVTPDEVLGATGFLEAGASENVTVTLAEPLAENATLAAVAHQETNQVGDTANATLDFVTSNGTDDVPYVDANGTTVADDANVTVEAAEPPNETASVSFPDQQTDGNAVVVDSVTLPEGGYVAIHDETLANDTLGSVIGSSEFLPAGTSENVTVALDDPLTVDQTLTAMAHQETNQANDTANATFDFVTSNGTDDGPYTDANGSAVVDTANVTVADVGPPPTDGDGPFDVTALQAPTQALPGDTVVVSALVTNPANETATERVDFRLEGDVLASQNVTLDASESTRVVFDVNTTGLALGEYDHGVFADLTGETAQIRIVDTASFEVSNLSAPASAVAGDTVTVNATVTNPNDERTTQPVDFRFDGAVLLTQQLSLDGGASETVTFEADTTGVDPGVYIHGVFTREDGQAAVIDLTEANVTPPTENASITFDDQTTDGTAVTVASASNASAPFYVAVWTLDAAGEPDGLLGLDQVLTNETSNVTVDLLNDSVTENQTLVAAVHPDLDGNASTAGDPDEGTLLATDTAAITVSGGVAPPTNETAAVTFDDQTTTGETVTVANTTLPEGGYVTIHDSTVGTDAVGSVVGVSSFLDAGTSENVTVTLDEPLTENQTLIAMPHQETNQAGDTANATYDFVTSNGTVDGPYTDANGTAITDDANVTVANATDGEPPAENASVTFEDQTTDGTEVSVASATNATGPFWVGVWTANSTGEPEQLLGTTQVIGAETTSPPGVIFDNETLTENQTLVAAVHPEVNGTADPATLLATDTANVTVAPATNETNTTAPLG